MDLVFGFLAGVLTLLNPCVLPVLPVVLITALNQHRLGPLTLCAGLSVTFVVVGLTIASLGPALGIDDQIVSRVASFIMILFGLTLVIPAASARFSLAATGASNVLSQRTSGLETNGLGGQFLTGVLLGAVWSPCIGPTLGGAIALASEGNNIPWAGAVMLSFALGVSTVIMLLATVSREALMRRRDMLQRFSGNIRTLTGVLLIALGLFLFFQLHHVVEAWAVEALPYWLQDLSVRF